MSFKCDHCDRDDFKSQRGLTQHLATEPCRSRAIATLGLANDHHNPNARSQGRITRQASALQNRAQTASRPSRVTQYVAQHDPGVQAEPKAPGRITRSMQSLEYRRGKDDLDGDDSEIRSRNNKSHQQTASISSSWTMHINLILISLFCLDFPISNLVLDLLPRMMAHLNVAF